ncbi:hypothetical protein C0Q70_21150 [Pomacea canaliculata]|uniref:Uncharacterized protein n=1 Tax=Pomacea canaliculata TaxID=400727 RepID=A0A2T7NBP8_POMCA|nr:hypothetical protein C0Q70_21150 [Pomacea canaliculata]
MKRACCPPLTIATINPSSLQLPVDMQAVRPVEAAACCEPTRGRKRVDALPGGTDEQEEEDDKQTEERRLPLIFQPIVDEVLAVLTRATVGPSARPAKPGSEVGAD